MKRYRFAWFEQNGETHRFGIDGSADFIREMVGEYWEGIQGIETCLFRGLNYARARLSSQDFSQFCLETGVFIEIGPDGTEVLEMLSPKTSHVLLQISTDWPGPLNKFKNRARKIISVQWKYTDAVWESISYILNKARLALPADEFDVFCAECGIYNEVDESGVIQFELLPPPKPLVVSDTHELSDDEIVFDDIVPNDEVESLAAIPDEEVVSVAENVLADDDVEFERPADAA